MLAKYRDMRFGDNYREDHIDAFIIDGWGKTGQE